MILVRRFASWLTDLLLESQTHVLSLSRGLNRPIKT
jgi:hypothetical protein